MPKVKHPTLDVEHDVPAKNLAAWKRAGWKVPSAPKSKKDDGEQSSSD